jgi:hypothetical protein
MQRKDVSKDSKANIIRKHPKKTIGGMQETFIMVDQGDQDTVAEIQGCNDPMTRAQLRKENKTIQEKGTVTEWKLRKNQILRANSQK